MMIFGFSLVLILLPAAAAKTVGISLQVSGYVTVDEPRDCNDILADDPSAKDGVYTITPSVGSGPIQVFCDMTNNGGGWTVIQRRTDGSVDFFRNWADYKKGFGSLVNEFWLGNDNIYRITNQRIYSIRFDLEKETKGKAHALYKQFFIDSEHDKYRLHVSGYSGDAGAAMDLHNGHSFGTKDQGTSGGNCAKNFLGGWWYAACHSVNLNGHYGNTTNGKGINWRPFTGYNTSLKQTTMKIRA